MIFKFTIISDEEDQFVRIIEIDSEATFLELNNSILDSVKFEKNQMTSFFICNDDWEKMQEITLVEMDSSSEYDNLVMESTQLCELLDDEKQKVLFVFDMISDRSFFLELSEIITGRSLSEAVCVRSVGRPPVQIIDDFEVIQTSTKSSRAQPDENFYGDEEFDIDELDEEGFGDLSFDDNSIL